MLISEKESGGLQIGSWVVVTADGIHESAFDGRLCFPTKREAIEDVRYSSVDTRKSPKVIRLAKGKYTYYPKGLDTGLFSDGYEIVKLTADNIDKYQRMWDEAEAAEQ